MREAPSPAKRPRGNPAWRKGAASPNPQGKPGRKLKGQIAKRLEALVLQYFEQPFSELLTALARVHASDVGGILLEAARNGDEFAKAVLIQGTTSPTMPKRSRKVIDHKDFGDDETH